MGMTQHSSGTPDPTGWNRRTANAVRPRARLAPRRRALAGDDLATGGRRGPARAGRRARPGRPGPRRRRAVRGAGPRRRMATRGRPAAGRRRPRPPPRAVARGGPPPLGGAPRRRAGRAPRRDGGRHLHLPRRVRRRRPARDRFDRLHARRLGQRGQPGDQAPAARPRVRVAGCRAGAAQDRCPQPPLAAGDRPARRTLRGHPAALPAPGRRHRARHRDVRPAGRGLAGGAGRPAAAPRRGGSG